MTESLTALASENFNPSLRSLLEDVQRGHIRVPRFQRPFVWTDRQRIELLRSIRDNMPIGSLLVWRTAKFKLASFTRIGFHSIPSTSDTAPSTGWQYLLDGHQRVSTLIGLLLSSDIDSDQFDDEDSIDWDIQYDLLDQDFVFAKKNSRRHLKRPLLPLWSLLDGRIVNKQMREIRNKAKIFGWNESDINDWEERADQLAYRFQQCRVPIVVMVSDDLELAATTFQRVNSLGTPMGEAHLVTALTWRANFDLRDLLKQMKATFPLGWRSVDEGLFLQVCKGLTNLDMTKTGQMELANKLKGDPAILDRAGQALKKTLDWISTRLGITHEEMMPYAFQVVLLALEIDRLGNDPIPGKVFENWFWRTSWSEVFANASSREVKAEREILQSAIELRTGMQWVRDQPLPTRFDFRSARVRMFVLRLAATKGITDDLGQVVNGKELLARYGRDALVRLFPIPRNASQNLKHLLQGVGNRFFIDPGKDASFRERLKYGPDFSVDALASHFCDSSGIDLLRNGDLEGFVQRRASKMEEWDHREFENAKESS